MSEKTSGHNLSTPTPSNAIESSELSEYLSQQDTPSVETIVRMYKLMQENQQTFYWIHRHVTKRVDRGILTLIWESDGCSYDDLDRFDCSRKTIQRTVRRLEEHGIVQRIHSNKMFVDFVDRETRLLVGETLTLWDTAEFGQG